MRAGTGAAGFLAFVALAVVTALVGFGFYAWLPSPITTWFVGDVRPGFDAGVIFLVAFLLSRAVRTLIRRALPEGVDAARAASIRWFADPVIGAFVLLGSFALFSVSAQSLFLGSAFVGIVLGLAGHLVISHLFAGIVVAAVHPHRPGDRISVVSSNCGVLPPTYPHERMTPEYTGPVTDLTLIYTALRLDDGQIAFIPNASVMSARIMNRSAEQGRTLRVRVTLPHGVPVSALEAAARQYTTRSPSAVGTPTPRVLVADVGPASWDGVVLLSASDARADEVRDQLLRTLLPSVGESTRETTRANR